MGRVSAEKDQVGRVSAEKVMIVRDLTEKGRAKDLQKEKTLQHICRLSSQRRRKAAEIASQDSE